MSDKQRVYLSGKVTGESDFFSKFFKAEEAFKDAGYEVANPALICAMLPKSYTHEEYMNVCMTILDTCDAVHVIDGEETSEGVKEEIAYAEFIGLPFIPFPEAQKAEEEEKEPSQSSYTDGYYDGYNKRLDEEDTIMRLLTASYKGKNNAE